MREIRPYGSEGGGGETLPTPISRRWWSEATPSDYEMGVKAAGTPAEVPDLLSLCSSGGVVAWAPQPPATGSRCLQHRFDQK